jgi:hypothetical protein
MKETGVQYNISVGELYRKKHFCNKVIGGGDGMDVKSTDFRPVLGLCDNSNEL